MSFPTLYLACLSWLGETSPAGKPGRVLSLHQWTETCPVRTELHRLYPCLHLYRAMRPMQFGNLICIKLGTWVGTFAKRWPPFCLHRIQFRLLPKSVSPRLHSFCSNQCFLIFKSKINFGLVSLVRVGSVPNLTRGHVNGHGCPPEGETSPNLN